MSHACMHGYFCSTGNPIVVVGTPDTAAKVFRAEGKYPVRGNSEENMDWIYKKNNFITMIFS